MEVTLKHPFSMLVAGGRGSGKTVFTKRLIQSDFIDQRPQHIVWCYAKHQPELYAELSKMNNVHYVEGIPSQLEFDRSLRNLIIFDDLMKEIESDSRVEQLFTRGRHDNLSVIYLTQNLFLAKQRSISLNSDYMVIFKNARDQSQFMHLAKQVMPNNAKHLLQVYQEATQKPHAYLFLDLRPATPDQYRVRSNILDSVQYVYMKS